MSIRNELRTVFYEHLIAQFPLQYGSEVAIGFENDKLDAPDNKEYIRAYFKSITSGRAAIGTTKGFERHKGFFLVDCYVPEDTGTKILLNMTDAVTRAFAATHFKLPGGGYVTVDVPKLMDSNNNKVDGSYYKSVMIMYIMDSPPSVLGP